MSAEVRPGITASAVIGYRALPADDCMRQAVFFVTGPRTQQSKWLVAHHLTMEWMHLGTLASHKKNARLRLGA